MNKYKTKDAPILHQLRAMQKMNTVLKQLKQANDKLFHQRKMKQLVNAIKQHKRNRIDAQVKVERADPPTVLRENVQDALENINLQDYSLTFSVTVTKQKLDEFGNLESEKDETTPEDVMKKAKYKNRNRKTTVTALTAFFNRYLLKMSKSLSQVKWINLIFSKKVRNPRPLMPLKEAMTTNCLIQLVMNKLHHVRKDWKTKLAPRLLVLNQKYFEQGVTEQAVDEICHAVQINIHIVSILQETWYHKHLGDTKLTLLICAHNNHATLHTDVDMLDLIGKENKGTVNYIEGLHQHFLDDPTPIKFPMVIKDQIVAYYKPNGDLYKNRDIFFDEADWKKNAKNDYLKNVFTLTSRYYTEFKMKYGLQDKYYNEDLYHFVKCTDQYTPPWQQDPDYAKNGEAFDQDRAYMFYEKSEHYEHYQFPRMPTHFYQTSNLTLRNKQRLLLKSGFAEVTNVVIPERLEFLRKTKFIQDGGVYTTLRLNWALKKGVTFDLTKIAWANDKQKLDFRIELTEWQANVGLTSKQEECSLMGRLIPNQNSTYTSLVHCKSDDEFLQLRFQLGDRVSKVDFDNKIVYYTQEQEKKLKGAYHVHAFILDYQQIECLPAGSNRE